MLRLTEKELATVLKARELGILQDFETELLPANASAGTCIIFCGDCDQSRDLVEHHSNKCGNQRHHILALNGGCLFCNPERQEDWSSIIRGVYIHNIRGAYELKDLTTLAPYTHAPRGVAKKILGLNIWEIWDHQMKAKQHLKTTAIPDLVEQGLKIMCFCHIDDGTKKRTYFVNPSNWTTHGKDLRDFVQ